MATAVEERRAAAATFRSPAEAREVLSRLLEGVESDERVGPALRASGMRERLELSDLGVVVNVRASERRGHCLDWDFSDRADWEPRLELRMPSEVANRYLQGRESVAVAIARGRISCNGDGRAALAHLPANRLLAEHYRRLVADSYPHLLTD